MNEIFYKAFVDELEKKAAHEYPQDAPGEPSKRKPYGSSMACRNSWKGRAPKRHTKTSDKDMKYPA